MGMDKLVDLVLVRDLMLVSVLVDHCVFDFSWIFYDESRFLLRLK